MSVGGLKLDYTLQNKDLSWMIMYRNKFKKKTKRANTYNLIFQFNTFGLMLHLVTTWILAANEWTAQLSGLFLEC